MNQQKFRHEYKFFINYSDYLALRARISAVASRDPHADENGVYLIRSLYFDNVYDRVLREKIDGVNNREKFRIRCYNKDDSFIRLEKKSKVNGLCNKLSVSISRQEAEKIISGDVEWMKKSESALMVEFYSKMRSMQLRPKVIVDYIREPYIFSAGNVRITFDYNLRTGLYNRNLFDFDTPTVPAVENSVLMEIKYDEYLPCIIRDIVQVNNRRSHAFSKYGACRMYG